ncbi:thermonuclease family protein [Mycoplasma marinum]|uniref:TNase-like domain-containing protein n=1 Tax=Mycoplasma marinum TaxID=1937190 RepID=A0A4R0XJU3_9MOLU|nr:thermonuclease family protein [Mycoplasma marinum]TCG10916.1 hypothetical protein C4B24_03590 [Mycoplasma marinum]
MKNLLYSFIKSLSFLTILLLCTLLISCSASKKENYKSTRNSFYSKGKDIQWLPNHIIKHIHDGDTFTDESNNVYRLFSVDTPEITTFTFNHKNESTVGLEHYWAQKATDFVKRVIQNKKVTIINKTHDVYHRLVSAVFYKDGEGNVKNLAMELIRRGLARIAFISKTNKMFNVDSGFFDYMQFLQEQARSNRVGLFKYDSANFWNIFPKSNVGI